MSPRSSLASCLAGLSGCAASCFICESMGLAGAPCSSFCSEVYSLDSTIPEVRVLTPGTAVAAWATADMPNVLAKMPAAAIGVAAKATRARDAVVFIRVLLSSSYVAGTAMKLWIRVHSGALVRTTRITAIQRVFRVLRTRWRLRRNVFHHL